MKQCQKCHVSVRGNRESCPLCQANLTGEGERELYPNIPTIYRQYIFLFKILLLATISGGIISVMVNILDNSHGYWSVLVLMGIACFWIMLSFAVKKRNNIPKNITYQVFFIALFSIVWDLLTDWRAWSVDFVIPIVFITGMAALAIIPVIMKIPVSEYLFLLIIDVFFGFTPLVFLLLGLVDIILPSYICIVVSIISFITLVIFYGKHMLAEVQRRFHL